MVLSHFYFEKKEMLNFTNYKDKTNCLRAKSHHLFVVKTTVERGPTITLPF